MPPSLWACFSGHENMASVPFSLELLGGMADSRFRAENTRDGHLVMPESKEVPLKTPKPKMMGMC